MSDDNGKMDPFRLGVWTSVAVNSATFKPTTKAILERYMTKHSKNGVLPPEHFDVPRADGEVDAYEDGGHYARYGEPQQDPRGTPTVVRAPAAAALAIAGPSAAPSAAEADSSEEAE